ncbi:sugar ABC transporter permease, partial [Caldilinea sp.]|uniref:carbohydrate ABC transporter permease n=1 Tax=Caldilinea sp. TaxID=2293560 RepID=UPI002B9B1684|nr:sugar ABC transporter permease [Anaerolineales bacterium]HQY92588.1 sugar ABC transporter permease [Caldilinea sp.]
MSQSERSAVGKTSLPYGKRRAGVMQSVRRYGLFYLLLAPTFLFAIAFYYYPLLSGIYHSFTYWDIKRTVWVGLDNYTRLFTNPATAAAWRNMALIVGSQMIVVLTLPLLGAALVHHVRRGQYWWRVAFVLPIVVPATVIVFVWRWFYGVDGGINYLLRLAGMEEITRAWLGDPATALWAIIFVGFPWVAGLNFLIYLAALQSIPEEVLDAARVDGATALRTFFQIELPMIRPQMSLLLMLTIIYYLRSFDAPLIMTNGGPGTTGTLVPGLQMYRSIRDELDLGYGSAIGTLLFGVLLAVSLLNLAIRRRLEKAA